MFEKPGAHMNCFVSDGETTLQEELDHTKYINEQYTADSVTIIPHEQFVAVASQSYVNGKFKIEIKLMTDYPDGTVIAQDQKEWQDQKPDALQVNGTSPHSRATCWPSIH